MSSVPRAALIVAVLTLSSLAGALPVVSAAPAGPVGGGPMPHAPTLAAPSAAAAVPAPPSAVHIRPSMLNCNPKIPWPAWGPTGDGLPPTPDISFQSGCGGTLYAAQDEVHNSFLSDIAGSAQHWSESIHVPDNSLPAQSYSAFYLQEVVSGDNQSAWNQSLVEVAFFPNQPTGFNMSLSVYTLKNDTDGAGHQVNQASNCSGSWMVLAWNSTYWCEGSDFANGNGQFEGNVAGGDWLNVSFAGNSATKGHGGTPLQIWVNDSTNTGDSWNATLNYRTTGTFNFTPSYRYANDTNLLQWGMGEGNGIGISLCPIGSRYTLLCDSYNSSEWYNFPTIEFGIPRFYNGSGYTGDYALLGFESTSGACGYVPGSSGNPTVAICIANTAGSGDGADGYYPYFSFNGSMMDFGGTYNWSTWDFGGSSIQFNPAGTMNSKPPLYLDRIQDSSRGGYVTNTTAFSVTSRLQVVGAVRNASLVYDLQGVSGWTSVAMTRVNGSLSLGYWNATVPAGAGGTINYWIYASDDAGEAVASIESQVVRGALPTFDIAISIDPTFCGTVVLNGTSYTNGQTAQLEPGTYTLSETGCWPYINPVFTPSHLLIVYNDQTRIDVRGAGTLLATWSFNPPKLSIKIEIAPSSCSATVQVGALGTFSNGQTVTVVWNRSNVLAENPCGQYVFAGYSGSSQVNVTTFPTYSTMVATTNGTLTVNYAPTSTALPVLFLIAPGNCSGGIVFNGATYVNDTTISVSSGSYDLGSAPCPRLGFLKWIFGGSPLPTFSSGVVTIASSSTIEMIQYDLTILTVVTQPDFCGSVLIDSAYNLSNGQTLVVSNNSTHTIEPIPCTGYFLLGVGVTGGLSLSGNIVTANGSGDIEASFTNSPLPDFVGFETDPAYCGTIGFNGGTFEDTNSTQVPPGTVTTLSATPCAGYGFLHWIGFDGVQVVGNTAYVNSSGSILAVFTELVNLYVHTNPADCGSVVIGGITLSNGATPAYPVGEQLSLATIPCAGDHLSSFTVVGVTLLDNQTLLQIDDPGTLLAIFEPISYAVTAYISPANCGTVVLNENPTVNGTTAQFGVGVYPLVIQPCPGDQVDQLVLSGGVAVVGPVGDQMVYVNGSGTISITFGAVPPELTASIPDTAGAGLGVFFGASIAVLVAPYNYTYNWTFGDGSAVTTDVNSTEHVYNAPGTYKVTVTVTDPLGRVATASGEIAVSSLGSTAQVDDAIPALIAGGIAVVVIALAWVYSGRSTPKRRPAPEEGTYGMSDGAAPAPEALPAPVDPSTLSPSGAPSNDAEPFPKEP